MRGSDSKMGLMDAARGGSTSANRSCFVSSWSGGEGTLVIALEFACEKLPSGGATFESSSSESRGMFWMRRPPALTAARQGERGGGEGGEGC